MNRAAAREETRPPGVIETLTAGYEVVNRRLWLLLFPIALDLLFWFGPKLSIVRVAGYLPLSAIGLEQSPAILEALAHVNLAFVLALYVPTVLGKLPFDGPGVAGAGQQPIFQVSPETLLVAVAVLIPLSLLVAAAYLGYIAQIVRPSVGTGGWLRMVVRQWWRLVVLHFAGLVAFIGLAVPAGLLIAAAGTWVSADVGSFLLLLFQVSLLWIGFYFFFALGATLLSDRSPVRAALSSVTLVRANFWSAVGLIGLMLIIDTGMPIVYHAVVEQPWGIAGLLGSIVTNAYIGTGLAAATMLYYRDRLALAG